jgi:hypothetical protein
MPSTRDGIGAYFLVQKFNANNKGWTEKSLLGASSMAQAVADATLLASWRARLLGRDAVLAFASVATLGPDRLAKNVIARPLQGGLGIKWLSPYVLKDTYTNSPESTLRIRQETAPGRNAMRQLGGIPDGLLNKRTYIGEATVDALDFGTYTTPDEDALAVGAPNELYPVGEAPPENAADFLTWQQAFKLYANAMHSRTQWWSKPYLTSGLLTISYDSWSAMSFRGVGNRKLGLPLSV